MSKIAVLISDQFEEVEYLKPVEVFKKNGHEIATLGLMMGEKVNIKDHEEE